MKKAVVFYGSMRELEMGSKSWHILGEDVDYFLVTWGDVVNNHYTDTSGSTRPFDLSMFPLPIKGSITPNFAELNQSLDNVDIPKIGMIYILYHWSLVGLLSEIHTYDKIIIARPDMFCANITGRSWDPKVQPGKVAFSGDPVTSEVHGVGDWIITTDPKGLSALYDLYHDAIKTRDFLNESGEAKIIHHYLHEKIKSNPEKFHYGMEVPVMVLVRPNYPKAWLKMPYGQLLAYLLVRHALEYEARLQNDNTISVDEKTIQTLMLTDFRIQ